MDRIYVECEDKVCSLDAYSTALDALLLLGKIDDVENYDYLSNPVVGAIVNGEACPLGKRLVCSSVVEPVHLFDSIGRRIYRHSLCFLLSLSASLAFPGRNLVIGHSLGDGFYFSFDDDIPLTETEVRILNDKMHSLIEKKEEIVYSALSGEDAIEVFKKLGRKDTVLLLESRNDSIAYTYSLDGYTQLSYEPLVPNTAVLSIFELRLYGKGLLLRYPLSQTIDRIVPLRDNPLLFSVFEEYRKWGKILSVRSIGEMNRVNIEGGMREYIRLSEDLQRRKIAEIADNVAKKDAKIVFVAGPSSSGKTTFSKRLCEELRLLGYKAFKLSLDDYYNPPSMAPKDENGKPDLEVIEALNIGLIDSNLTDLVSGKDVSLPSYDFNTHITSFNSAPVRLGEKCIAVIEGIHALNERITGCIDSSFVYKVYISALTQLNLDDSNRVSTTDNRLLRRLLRDYRTRGMSVVRTLNMWPNVTKAEREHIFPHQNNADVMFNSALDYEIGVLMPSVEPLLKSVKVSDGPCYELSRRLLGFLRNVYPITSTYVPSNSILREFIGDSDYE